MTVTFQWHDEALRIDEDNDFIGGLQKLDPKARFTVQTMSTKDTKNITVITVKHAGDMQAFFPKIVEYVNDWVAQASNTYVAASILTQMSKH